MSNILNIIIFGISIFGFSTSFVQTKKFKIEECINNIPQELINKSVVNLDENEESDLYFNKEGFESNYKSFLRDRFTDPEIKISIGFFYFYYDISNKPQVYLLNKPQNVQVHFKVSYTSFINCEKYYTYSLKGGK